MSRIRLTLRKCFMLIMGLLVYSVPYSFAYQLSKGTSVDVTYDIPRATAVGKINTKVFENTFYNMGNFSQTRLNEHFFWGIYVGEPPNAPLKYMGDQYIACLDLWLGIPVGEWTPKKWSATASDSVTVGPTVSGTYFDWTWYDPVFEFQRWRKLGTDWGPDPEAWGRSFSGDLLLSDIEYTQDDILPLLAHSMYPLSWPQNIYGDRVWPGKWAVDSETARILPGVFRADKEVVLELTDIGYAGNTDLNAPSNFSGYDIGAKVYANVLVFEEIYADDYLFFDLTITNESKWDYNGVYLGSYCYPHIHLENYATTPGEYHLDYLTSEYNADLQHEVKHDLSYFYRQYNTIPSEVVSQIVGIKFLETPIALQDGKDNDKDGFIDEIEGEQLGLTGWHWLFAATQTQPPFQNLERGDFLQYKLLSGDTTGLYPHEQDMFFFPRKGHVDPNFDDLQPEDVGYYLAHGPPFLMSSGPFNFPSGSKAKFAFVVIFGDDYEDLKFKSTIAQRMYNNNYRRMEAPAPPKVCAVAGDGQVTLYWDDAAEKNADYITDYKDFEGYRIYRTSINPEQGRWGEEILDAKGNHIGFVPVAQFDLADDIGGYDPLYPHLWLGSDTGLEHSWTDTSVHNGVSYWYAVCAYDRGITSDSPLNPHNWPEMRSLENSRGTDPDLYPHLVKVIPGAVPSNAKFDTVSLAKLPGTRGNGPIIATVVAPEAVTGHTYTIVFDDTSTTQLTYEVIDENSGSTMVADARNFGGPEGKVFDGILLEIENYDRVLMMSDSSAWFNWQTGDSSECTYTIEASTSPGSRALYNYEIRFTSEGDSGRTSGRFAPFEVWNISKNIKIEWDYLYSSENLEWNSGNKITTFEEVESRLYPWIFTLRSDPIAVISQRDTLIDGEWQVVIDTTWEDIPPTIGDAARIVTTKPFHSGDRFSIQTFRASIVPVAEDELSKIRVVPNPYLVSAGWELSGEDHRISFTHLPAECEIVIFTVSGETVAVLAHNNPYSGTEFWNLQNHEHMEVASGLYIYVVKTPEGLTKHGKFVVVR